MELVTYYISNLKEMMCIRHDRIKYMIENTKNNLNHFVNFLCPWNITFYLMLKSITFYKILQTLSFPFLFQLNFKINYNPRQDLEIRLVQLVDGSFKLERRFDSIISNSWYVLYEHS